MGTDPPTIYIGSLLLVKFYQERALFVAGLVYYLATSLFMMIHSTRSLSIVYNNLVLARWCWYWEYHLCPKVVITSKMPRMNWCPGHQSHCKNTLPGYTNQLTRWRETRFWFNSIQFTRRPLLLHLSSFPQALYFGHLLSFPSCSQNSLRRALKIFSNHILLANLLR